MDAWTIRREVATEKEEGEWEKKRVSKTTEMFKSEPNLGLFRINFGAIMF